MKEYIYKTETFGCTFSTKKGINNKLQELLDEYSSHGWRLHTMEVCGASGICVCVFEKEKN